MRGSWEKRKRQKQEVGEKEEGMVCKVASGAGRSREDNNDGKVSKVLAKERRPSGNEERVFGIRERGDGFIISKSAAEVKKHAANVNEQAWK